MERQRDIAAVELENQSSPSNHGAPVDSISIKPHHITENQDILTHPTREDTGDERCNLKRISAFIQCPQPIPNDSECETRLNNELWEESSVDEQSSEQSKAFRKGRDWERGFRHDGEENDEVSCRSHCES